MAQFLFTLSVLVLFGNLAALPSTKDFSNLKDKSPDFVNSPLMKSTRNSVADTKKTEEMPKSAAKPEELDKARTHGVSAIGLQSIVDSIKAKLHHTNLVPGLPIPVSQPYVQPFAHPYPYGYYASPAAVSIAHPSPLEIPAQPSFAYSSPSYGSGLAINHGITTITKPAVSYGHQVVQKPVYTISQQVIHKPVYTEIQEVIHKPVYTEVQEVIHKPVLTEVQQVIKKPLYTEHVVKKPLYNAVHQEVVDRPLHLQSEQYHIMDKPVSQVVNLPQQVVQPYATHVVQTPVYHQQTAATYHPIASSVVPSYSSPFASGYFSAGFPHYAGPLNSNLAYWNNPYSSSWFGGYSGYGNYHYSPVASSFGPVAPSISPVVTPVISSPAVSTVHSPAVSVASVPSYGYPLGSSYGHWDDYSDYQYGFYSPSFCRSPGGCGGIPQAKDNSGYYQEMNFEPEYETPLSYGSSVQPQIQFQPMNYSPMPYPMKLQYPSFAAAPATKEQQQTSEQRQATASKTTGAKSAEEDSSSGDASRYLVPTENQQGYYDMSSMNQQKPYDQNPEDFLKNAINEEEKRRNAIKSDLSNLEMIARKVQETPEIMDKLQNIIDEVVEAEKKQTGSQGELFQNQGKQQ